jgi:hypothetical protein
MYVIVEADGPCFWSGAEWVYEYPDAELYGTLEAAKKAAEGTGRACEVVERYGYENERTVFRAEPKA